MRRIVLLCCFAISFSFNAFSDTEIYRCLSDDGHVSYGDSPCPQQFLEGSGESAVVWRQMHDMVKAGLEVNSTLGPDVYSIMACLDQSANYHSKLDAIEKPLSELSLVRHQDMYDAMLSLRVCGECRVSAPNYCEKASSQLEKGTQERLSSR